MVSVLADSSSLLTLLGRAHPLLLHAPLGVLPAMALLEFGALVFRRPEARGAVLTLAWFNAVCALLAAVSGLMLAREGYEGGDTVRPAQGAGHRARRALSVLSASAGAALHDRAPVPPRPARGAVASWCRHGPPRRQR
jgi:hypothetical protein